MFCQFREIVYLCTRNRETTIQNESKAKQKEQKCSIQDGPFVYRLGRKIFILERGVRFPHGLPNKEVIEYSIASLFLSCFVQGMPTAQLENGSALKFRPLTRK